MAERIAGQQELDAIHREGYVFLKKSGQHILFKDYKFQATVSFLGTDVGVRMRSVTELRGPMVFVEFTYPTFKRNIGIKAGKQKQALVSDVTLKEIEAGADMRGEELLRYEQAAAFRNASGSDVYMFRNVVRLAALGGAK